MFIDYAFLNGKIYTLEGYVAEAIAISGERISAVGKTDEIKALCSSKTEIIDLKDKCLFPGFNDSHMHFLLYGLLSDKIDLKGSKSVEEIIERGRRFIRENNRKAGEWIIGYGFDQNTFNTKEFPMREDVDRISSNHPILLDRICGHIGIANTLALKKIGITRDTVIEGGIIEKDSDGNPTGVLKEAALDWFKSRIPKPGVPQIKKIIKNAAMEALSFGLTSIQTDDLEATDFKTMFESYKSLAKEGELAVRVYEEVQAPRPNKLMEFLADGMRTGFGSDYFKIGNIKLLTDGSLGARSAALREDYSDEAGNKGILVYTQEELDEIIEMAYIAGMQVACHAIGDGAIEQCINAIEKAIKKYPKSLRPRIVHCQIGDLKMFKRMADIGIAADIQPAFVPSDYDIVEERIGLDRARKSYAWETMLNCGIHLGCGSDCPVETFDPLWGIYCSVTRTDIDGKPAGGWLPEEKLSVDEAIKLYTIGSAYLSFDENKKGTIKEGKLADLVVLSEDPFRVKPHEIKDIKVLLAMVGGKIRYVYNKR